MAEINEKEILALADEFKNKSDEAKRQMQQAGHGYVSDMKLKELQVTRDNFLYAAMRIVEVVNKK